MENQLTDNFDAKWEEADGMPLLCLVASAGLLDAVMVLVGMGLDVNERDNRGRSALIHAAEFGDRRIVEYLLDNGADINLRDHCGKTAVMVACDRWNDGCAEVAKLLLQRKASVHYADLCELFINSRAHLKQSDGWYRDALWLATFAGHFNSCVTLLRHGAPWWQLYGRQGRSLLSIAARYGHPWIVNLYLRQGLDVHQADDAGKRPLHYAAIGGSRLICEDLIDWSANVDDVDDAGWTPLMYAAKRGHKDCVEALIKHKAKIDHAAVQGETALTVARDRKRDDCVKVLINHCFKLPKRWL